MTLSLSKKTILTISIPTIILFFVISLFLSYKIQQHVLNNEEKLLNSRVDYLVSEIGSNLTEPERVLEDISFFISYGHSSNEKTLSVLTELTKQFPGTNGFYAGFENKDYLDGSGWTPDKTWDATKRPWYTNAKTNPGKVVYSAPYMDDDTHSTVVSLSKTFKNKESNNEGVVAFDYYVNVIEQFVLPTLKEGEEVFIIDKNGQFIYHKEYSLNDYLGNIENGKYKRLIESFVTGNNTFSPEEFGGHKYYFKSAPIEETGWHLVMGTPEISVKQFANKVRLSLLFGFGSLLLMILILVRFRIKKAVKPLERTAKAFKQVSEGNADLTMRLSGENKDEVGQVVTSFNTFITKLHDIVSKIKESKDVMSQIDYNLQNSTQDTASAITQIMTNIKNVSKQITNEADSMQEASLSINNISSEIDNLSKMIENQSAGVAQASAAVEEMLGNIANVNKSISSMTVSFDNFNRKSQEGVELQKNVDKDIMDIMEQSKLLQEANTVIANIASQTKLLAMNAAIEAAHAGEAGNGFRVVADEIRKLSETSTSQSSQIKNQLKHIADTINNVVKDTSNSSHIFSSVSEQIQKTDSLVQEIKLAMSEQQEGSKQIFDSLNIMSNTTLEVKNASSSMSQQKDMIIQQVDSLVHSTNIIKDSVIEMSSGAYQINQTGSTLSDLSNKMKDSIVQIGCQIDEFKI